MNACGAWCGFCGRCDDDTTDRPPVTAYPFCDACGRQIYVGAKSLAGVGIACSDRCLNRLCVQHENAMAARMTAGR